MYRILISLILVGFCTSVSGAWEAIGPSGGYLRSVVISPTDENIIYAATWRDPCKIVKSTDCGATWVKQGSYPEYNYCLAIDPIDAENLYAGCYERVYRSTNSGTNWNSAYLADIMIYDLEVHPTNPLVVYAAGRKYTSSNYEVVIVKSTNSGIDWMTTVIASGSSAAAYGMAIDPVDPDNIYVCGYVFSGTTYYPKVFKSTDGGSNFTDISWSSTVGYYAQTIAVHPTNNNIVYAGTYNDGIYRSTDSGSSWTKVTSYNFASYMATTPVQPDLVFASAYSYVYRSTDAGITWTVQMAGLDGSGHYGLAISQSNSANVFIGNNTGFFKSTNTGSNWFASNHGMNIGNIIGMGIAGSMPSTIYITVEGDAVYKTTNNGSNWTELPYFSSCGDMCDFAVHNTNPNIVMALEGYG